MEPGIKIIVLVSIFISLGMVSYVAFSNVVTKIYEQEEDYVMGPLTMAIIYGTLMITTFFVSLLRGYSEKWILIIASLANVFICVSGFPSNGLPMWLVYGIKASLIALSGIGGAFLWTTIGFYIHKAAHLYGEVEDTGKYFGIFNAIANLSTPIGGLVVTLGLPEIGYSFFYLLPTLIAILALIFGIFFVKELREPEPSLIINQEERR